MTLGFAKIYLLFKKRSEVRKIKDKCHRHLAAVFAKESTDRIPKVLTLNLIENLIYIGGEEIPRL